VPGASVRPDDRDFDALLEQLAAGEPHDASRSSPAVARRRELVLLAGTVLQEEEARPNCPPRLVRSVAATDAIMEGWAMMAPSCPREVAPGPLSTRQLEAPWGGAGMANTCPPAGALHPASILTDHSGDAGSLGGPSQGVKRARDAVAEATDSAARPSRSRRRRTPVASGQSSLEDVLLHGAEIDALPEGMEAEVRRLYLQKRPRIKGRFVRKEELGGLLRRFGRPVPEPRHASATTGRDASNPAERAVPVRRNQGPLAHATPPGPSSYVGPLPGRNGVLLIKGLNIPSAAEATGSARSGFQGPALDLPSGAAAPRAGDPPVWERRRSDGLSMDASVWDAMDLASLDALLGDMDEVADTCGSSLQERGRVDAAEPMRGGTVSCPRPASVGLTVVVEGHAASPALTASLDNGGSVLAREGPPLAATCEGASQGWLANAVSHETVEGWFCGSAVLDE